jgi:hypothetical protein
MAHGALDKLGKADAEKDFTEKLVPMVQVSTIIGVNAINSASASVTEPTRYFPPRDYLGLLYTRDLSRHGQPDPFSELRRRERRRPT